MASGWVREEYSRALSLSHTTFAFALWDDAAWVSPCEVTQTMSGAQIVWRVVLQKDNRRQDFGLFNEVTFDNISADKIAEMRLMI